MIPSRLRLTDAGIKSDNGVEEQLGYLLIRALLQSRECSARYAEYFSQRCLGYYLSFSPFQKLITCHWFITSLVKCDKTPLLYQFYRRYIDKMAHLREICVTLRVVTPDFSRSSAFGNLLHKAAAYEA